jgi:hypothetical protein
LRNIGDGVLYSDACVDLGGKVSPILVRPVREQLEHDRVIRLLQAKYRRKHEVAINVGLEQATPVQIGNSQLFPDLVLLSQEKSRKLQGTVEVETGESINSLEAMAQWVPFSRLKAPFILYIPLLALDAARRLCAAHGADPAEIWTYTVSFDQVRFALAHRSSSMVLASVAKAAKPDRPAKAKAVARPAAKKAAVGKTPPARLKAAAKPKATRRKPAAKKAVPKKAAARKVATKPRRR